jgi:hypothetical protein
MICVQIKKELVWDSQRGSDKKENQQKLVWFSDSKMVSLGKKIEEWFDV